MYLVTIYWDEDSPLNPLIGLIYWIRALILIIPISWRNSSSERGNAFYWPTENWILRFGRNAKLSSLQALSVQISVKFSCTSSYMSISLNSRWNYIQLPFPKGFSLLKDLGTFIIVPYKIPWLMRSILFCARLLAWAFLFTFLMAHRHFFPPKTTGQYGLHPTPESNCYYQQKRNSSSTNFISGLPKWLSGKNSAYRWVNRVF